MIANARIARTKAMLTSRTPHHFGQDSVFRTKPATKGNSEEIKNTTAAAMASGRRTGALASVIRIPLSKLVRVRLTPNLGASHQVWSCIARKSKGNTVGTRLHALAAP